MAYELRHQVLEAPKLAEALGGELELREMTVGQVLEARDRGIEGISTSWMLLGGSLYCDGNLVGIDRLKALPGRLIGPLNDALVAALHLYDEGTELAEENEPVDDIAKNGLRAAA